MQEPECLRPRPLFYRSSNCCSALPLRTRFPCLPALAAEAPPCLVRGCDSPRSIRVCRLDGAKGKRLIISSLRFEHLRKEEEADRAPTGQSLTQPRERRNLFDHTEFTPALWHSRALPERVLQSSNDRCSPPNSNSSCRAHLTATSSESSSNQRRFSEIRPPVK